MPNGGRGCAPHKIAALGRQNRRGVLKSLSALAAFGIVKLEVGDNAAQAADAKGLAIGASAGVVQLNPYLSNRTQT